MALTVSSFWLVVDPGVEGVIDLLDHYHVLCRTNGDIGISPMFISDVKLHLQKLETSNLQLNGNVKEVQQDRVEQHSSSGKSTYIVKYEVSSS